MYIYYCFSFLLGQAKKFKIVPKKVLVVIFVGHLKLKHTLVSKKLLGFPASLKNVNVEKEYFY
jgi:ACT domain-containing protein